MLIFLLAVGDPSMHGWATADAEAGPSPLAARERGPPSHHPDAVRLEAALRAASANNAWERQGTAAMLRRAISRLLNTTSTDASGLVPLYARLYRHALREGLLMFLHLSKAGGTAICELSKLNGCDKRRTI